LLVGPAFFLSELGYLLELATLNPDPLTHCTCITNQPEGCSFMVLVKSAVLNSFPLPKSALSETWRHAATLRRLECPSSMRGRTSSLSNVKVESSRGRRSLTTVKQ
jgi:hypothetical protein